MTDQEVLQPGTNELSYYCPNLGAPLAGINNLRPGVGEES